jgi:hypothetical protein
MTLPPQSLLLVPEATVAAVQASFPKGNLYVEFRAEFGPLYDDQRFADLYPPSPGALSIIARKCPVIIGNTVQPITGNTARSKCWPSWITAEWSPR